MSVPVKVHVNGKEVIVGEATYSGTEAHITIFPQYTNLTDFMASAAVLGFTISPTPAQKKDK